MFNQLCGIDIHLYTLSKSAVFDDGMLDKLSLLTSAYIIFKVIKAQKVYEHTMFHIQYCRRIIKSFVFIIKLYIIRLRANLPKRPPEPTNVI